MFGGVSSRASGDDAHAPKSNADEKTRNERAVTDIQDKLGDAGSGTGATLSGNGKIPRLQGLRRGPFATTAGDTPLR